MVALLQMIERDVVFRDLSLENPIRAMEVSTTSPADTRSAGQRP